MGTRLAALRAPAVAALAVMALLSVTVRATRAGEAGTWQPLYGPSQSGGAMALDENLHRLFAWGGDHTNLVHLLPLDGFPYPWQVMTTTGTPPLIRSGHALVFDSNHDRLIVFGGTTSDGTALNDVWQLTLGATPTWSHLAPTGPGPDPRSGFGATYDPVSGKMYVFGGLDTDGNVEPNDLYVLDLNPATPVWSMPAQSGTIPSGRLGSPLTVDPYGRRLMMFGGNDGFYDLSDEYEMDLASFTWSSDPTSGITPDPRSGHVCAFDQLGSKLIVWGGTAGDDSLRALDMSTREWSAPSYFIGPPGHGGSASLGVYDYLWDRLMVLAGSTGAEIWQFQMSSPEDYWYPLGPTAYPIAGSFVVDRAKARAIAYGGLDWFTRATKNDFWQFGFTAPLGWNGVNTGGIFPPSRTAHLAVWDQKHARMLVIGGRDETVTWTNSVYALQDSADFENWQQLAPTGTPPSARGYSAGIYDPVGDRVLMFGGLSDLGMLGGLYQLSLTPSPAWTTLAPSGGPNGAAGASAIYDEPRRRMILFGGIDSLGNYRNDTWALNLPGATWTHLAPTGTPPAGRWKHTAVYDSRRGRMLVFGGRVTSADSADTWELNLASNPPAWTRLAPAGFLPLYRSEAGAVYDSTEDRMLVYGGVSLIGPSTAIGNQDLWGLQFSGTTVTAVPPAVNEPLLVGAPAPNPARGASRLAYELNTTMPVHAAVYDLAGRRLRALVDGVQAAGPHELAWDGRDAAGERAPAGLYFYRLQMGGTFVSRKVVLVR